MSERSRIVNSVGTTQFTLTVGEYSVEMTDVHVSEGLRYPLFIGAPLLKEAGGSLDASTGAWRVKFADTVVDALPDAGVDTPSAAIAPLSSPVDVTPLIMPDGTLFDIDSDVLPAMSHVAIGAISASTASS